LEAKAVILTAGTFLRGKIFVGKHVVSGGRLNEPSEERLSLQLQDWASGWNASRPARRRGCTRPASTMTA
jgi:tRNA U34 5-carboxymethylaminomethyl modifying enzyme MnmG/GidA